MKSIICVFLSFVMVFSLFSVTAFSEELGSFDVVVYSGEDKAVISWDNIENAEIYKVYVTSTNEYLSFSEATTETSLDWSPYDVNMNDIFDIKVVACSDDGVKLCESNPLQVSFMVMNFDYWSYYGDTDLDLNIDVTDATWILNYLAKNVYLENAKVSAADVDSDGKVSVLDATIIQRFCAELPVFEDSDVMIGAPFFYGGIYFDVVNM